MTKKRNKSHQRPRPTLAVCVIARNEEEFIGACLDSVRSHVDELIVVDTGSTDRTVELATERGARVEHFEWCDDFAAARNVAIDAAHSEWILMLDADEELDTATVAGLRRRIASPLPGDTIGYSVMIENRRRDGSEDSIRHCVTRLFPRRQDVRYMGAIHEDLFRVSAPKRSTVTFIDDVRIFHYGYDPAVYVARAKDERNLHLLTRALEKQPGDPRILFHLGQQHRVGRRFAEASAALEAFQARADELPKHYLVDAYRMWIEALIGLEDEAGLNTLVQRAEDAEALSAQSHHLLAQYELKREHLGLALRHCYAALNPDAPMGVAAEPGVGGWRTRLLLAEIHSALDEPVLALEQLERVLPELPASRRSAALLDAARLARFGEAVNAVARVDRAVAVFAADFEVQAELLLIRLDLLHATPTPPTGGVFDELDEALAFGDWQTAYDQASALSLGGTSALVRIVYLAEKLRERRAPEAALGLLNRAIDVYSSSEPVYWLLVQVLTDLERYDDALLATEVLRRLRV